MISAFSFIPFKNKLASLIYFNNGAVTYYLTATNHALFLLVNLKKKINILKKTNVLSLQSPLLRIKKLSFISSIELTPGRGAQYVRSPGTKARIISFDNNNQTSLLQLPSKIKKIFSYYSFALTAPVALMTNRNLTNGKAGY
jgi:ribosomal protein L2